MDGIGGIILNAALLNNAKNATITNTTTVTVAVENLNPIVTLPSGIANVSVTDIPMKLNVKPSSNIGVNIATTSTGVTIPPATLSFTPDNFATEQRFTITVNILNSCANTFPDIQFTLTAGSTFSNTYSIPVNIRKNVKCTFVTTATTNGAFGGIAGGDAFCMANIPSALSGVGSGTYKAFLGITSVRSQTPLLDWVFQPGFAFFRQDTKTRIGIANSSSLFDLPLENSPGNNSPPLIHTGGVLITSTSFNLAPICANFTSSIGMTNRAASPTDPNLNHTASVPCSNAYSFWCIEQ